MCYMKGSSCGSEKRERRGWGAMFFLALLLFAFLFCLPGEGARRSFAGMHSWVDEQGVMHFSDKPVQAAKPKMQQGEAPPTDKTSAPAQATLPAGHGPVFMWKVSTATNFVYLLGSMHFVQAGTYPLDPRIEAAYEQCPVIAVESDVEGKQGQLQALTLKLGMYEQGDTLDKHISPQTIALLREKGFWNPLFLQMKPWLLALQLQNQQFMMLGYDMNSGIDRYFLRKAKARGKKVKELEDMGATLRLLASASEGREDEFLSYSIKELDRTAEVIPNINRHWKKGDAKGMADLILGEISRNPEFREFGRLLFDERNKAMAAKVEQYLKSGTPHFVIAGAGHMVGSMGIPRLLEQRGYDVVQIGAE